MQYPFGSILLYYGVRTGNILLVQSALGIGADIHFNNDSALFLAIVLRKDPMIQLLLEHGADVQMENGFPLRYVVVRRSLELIRCLIRYGANTRVIVSPEFPLPVPAWFVLDGHVPGSVATNSEMIDTLLRSDLFYFCSVPSRFQGRANEIWDSLKPVFQIIWKLHGHQGYPAKRGAPAKLGYDKHLNRFIAEFLFGAELVRP